MKEQFSRRRKHQLALIPLTIRVDPHDRLALRNYAAFERTTASDLIRRELQDLFARARQFEARRRAA